MENSSLVLSLMRHAYVLHIIAGILSALSELRLCGNQLTVLYQMHHAYVLHIIAGMLSALSELRLRGNQLTGALPDTSWGRGLQGLKILDLAGVHFPLAHLKSEVMDR